jgi:hypothetical protein
MEEKDLKNEEEHKARKKFEEQLDKAGEKFSKAVSETIKRMEEAFEESKENLRGSVGISDKYKNLFNYPTVGFLLLIVGFVWLMYTVGFFDNKFFPIVMMIIGLYMILRKR